MEVILSAQNICKKFNNSKQDNQTLDHISLDIYEGDFTVIMGRSGAGKSTLLYALSGMDDVSSGSIIYKGKDIVKYNEKNMSYLRTNNFGFVFQQTHLVSYLTLLENTLVAGYKTSKNKKEIQEKADILFKQMNVEHVKNSLPSEVSGGEAQRATIARALINQPDILFADEPTGALNKANTEQVLDLLSQVHQNGQSILMVTHDIKAAVHADRLIYLEDGKIIGEKKLPPYLKENAKHREEEILEWLATMEW